MDSAWAVRVALALVSLLCGTEEVLSAKSERLNSPANRLGKATYVVVPIKGVVGYNFTAAQMQACIDEAQSVRPAVVIVEVDTPGGLVSEAEQIVDMLIRNRNLRFVALVHKAMSAGAPIALACPEIYVTETATIGAAASFVPGPDGMPVDLPPEIAEKMRSAWLAVCRKAAQSASHPSVVSEAMADRDFALTMRKEHDHLIFEKDGEGEVVKPKGRILTLTAREAMALGIAEDVVPDIRSLGRKWGLEKWHNAGSKKRVQRFGVLRSPKSLFANMPAELAPDPDLGWSLGQRKLVVKWLESRHEGNEMLWDGALSEVSRTIIRGGAVVRTIMEPLQVEVPKGMHYQVHCSATFPVFFKEGLSRLQTGSAVRVIGRIGDIRFVPSTTPRGPEGYFSITLEECSFAREEARSGDKH